jgi:hypothetical protein
VNSLLLSRLFYDPRLHEKLGEVVSEWLIWEWKNKSVIFPHHSQLANSDAVLSTPHDLTLAHSFATFEFMRSTTPVSSLHI